MRTSITTRIGTVVLVLHALLLPALYFGISLVVERSHADVFVQHVRTYARNLAEELENGTTLDSPQRATDFLDLAIAHGDGVYAELLDNDRSLRSSLGQPALRWHGRNDLGFGAGGDGVHYLALPIVRPGHTAELRMGFDEGPTLAQIQRTRLHMLWALGLYLALAIAATVVFGHRLARPIVELARAARRIASGDYGQTLQLASGVRELHDVGRDLENMRGELVGVNQRLRAEIVERERAEVRRHELEARLRHRQRIETIGTLAGGIAHEINNALLPIMLLAESTLNDLPPGSPVRDDLAAILSSARRAKDIVVQVLTFSREAGDAVMEPIELAPAVREAMRLFALVAPSTVQVRLQLPEALPRVRADAAMLVQLLINLCTNAYQAMPDGTGQLGVALDHVRVDTAAVVPAGDYVVLSTTDTGHGMSAATMERIFEPFFTTREVGRGTGLGLAVAHGIAEAFNATIVVDSELGVGSTFRVYLPAAPEPAPALGAAP